jgi:hypothetical protein
MNCEQFWKSEPGSTEHLKECAACASRWRRHEELAAGLHTLGGQMRRLEAPARVERALVAAFRGQAAVGESPTGSWWLVAAWAAALAATIFLALALVRPHAPQQTRRSVRSLTQLASLELPAAGDAEAAYDDFLPLPNMDAVGANEEINVVRIEVPRSAMIPLGFTVSEERAAEKIEADVMLDASGVARAVRFLDPEKSSREMTW